MNRHISFLLLTFSVLLNLSCITSSIESNSSDQAMTQSDSLYDNFNSELFTADYGQLKSYMKNLPSSHEGSLKIALSQQDFVLSSDSRVKKTFKLVYEILSDQALEQWGNTSISWSPWYQEKPSIRIRVSNPDGQVWEMDESDAVEQAVYDSNPLIYSDARVLRMPIAGIKIGSIVEETIEIIEHKSFFSVGVSNKIGFRVAYQTEVSRITIEHPNDMRFKVGLNGLEDDVHQIVDKGSNLLHIIEPGDSLFDRNFEYYVPYDNSQWASVSYSTAENWQTIAEQYSIMVNEAISAMDFSSIAETLKSQSATESIENVNQYIRENIRYTGLLLGEKSIYPTTVSEILNRKFGDCKDMAVVAVGILREMGFDAHVALLRSGFDSDVYEDMPGMGLFNHAIVKVSDENDIWFDPTSRFGDYLTLPLQDQGRLALIASVHTDELMVTPMAPSSINRIENIAEITLAESGKGVFRNMTRYSGAIAAWYRGKMSNSSPVDAENELVDSFGEIMSSGEVAFIDWSDPDVMNEPFEVKWQINDFGRSMSSESESLVALMPFMFLNELPDIFFDERSIPREYDFYTTVPFVVTWNIKIVPPVGFEVSTLPDPIDLEMGNMTLTIDYALNEDQSISVVSRLDTGKRLMDPDVFKEAVTAILDFYWRDGLLFYFEHQGDKLISRGEFAEGLSIYREAHLNNPDNHIHLIQYADALTRAGMGFAGRVLIEEAIEKDPLNPELHYSLGKAYCYDIVGRYKAIGWEREEAIASFNKSIELDPEYSSPWYDLARAQELNAKSDFGGPGSDLEGALYSYNKIIQKFNDPSVIWEAIDVALFLNDYETARELSGQIDDNYSRRYYSFVLDILEAEIDNISSIIYSTPSEYKQSFLADCETLLLSLREYKKASRIIRIAAKGTDAVLTAESRAAFLETFVKTDERFGNTEIEHLALNFLLGVLSFQTDNGALLKTVLSDDLYRDFLSYEDEMLREMMSYFNSIMKNTGLSETVTMDMFRTIMEVQYRGSKESGYVAILSFDVFGQSDLFDILIGEVDGRLCIIGSTTDYSLISRYILDKISENNIEAASFAMDYLWNSNGPSAFILKPFYSTLPEDDSLQDAATYLAAEGGDTVSINRISEQLKPGSINNDVRLFLARSSLASGDTSKSIELAMDVLESDPLNEMAASIYLNSLVFEEKWDSILTSADNFKKLGISDRTTIGSEIMAANSKGNWDLAEQLLIQEVTYQSDYPAGVYNSLSWLQLFRDNDDKAMDYIIKSLQHGGEHSAAILHTAAAVLGKVGRAEDALAMLQRSMDISGVTEPQSHDWLVLGYIALSYDLLNEAEYAFHKVEYEKDPLSSHILAEKAIANVLMGQ